MKRRLIGISMLLAITGTAGSAWSDLQPPPFDPKDPHMASYISGTKRSGYTPSWASWLILSSASCSAAPSR